MVGILFFLLVLLATVLVFRFAFILIIGFDDGGDRRRTWVPPTRIGQMLYEWSFQQAQKSTQRRLKRQQSDRERVREYERKLMLKERRDHEG